MNNFLITGSGRTGTAFLSRMLNRSKIWTVRHEVTQRYESMMENTQQIPGEISRRFERDDYGEVNSRLRWVAEKMDVSALGVILRDPEEIWISTANRRRRDRWGDACQRLLKSLRKVNWLADRDHFCVIDFHRMTTEVGYLRWVAEMFQVDDIVFTEEDLSKKINATKNPQYTDMGQFSKSIKNLVAIMSQEYQQTKDKWL